MRATLSGLLLAAAASIAVAHGHEGKWLYGYQGWFRKPASGVNNHWSPNGGTPGPDNVEFEFVPDVSQYPANCLFTSTLTAPNGQPVQLYDNTCQGVVDLHFKWMQQYGIDGIIVQRFLSHLSDASFITVSPQPSRSRRRQIRPRLHRRIRRLRRKLRHRQRRPTVAINVTDGANIAAQLKNAGAYVGYGVPANFGTDVRANTGFAAAYKAANLISPWTVGSFSNGGYLKGYHTTTQIPDSQTLQSLGIDHAPLIWPGTSAYHLNGVNTPANFDYFARFNGSFYSMQADAIASLAVKPLFAFNAMFDEINEGTQSLPCLKNNQLPTNEKFVGYDNTFTDTAFYLELGGQKAAAFAAAVK
ncbi:hypothetical protein THARTR1_01804 [Trichoderma harzianum]|uniref:Uncharacterized protein n=1 Tax=Trichoderma harzianum TaxID=5544 RepID=A0A2K0UKH8_TRIHA|nr:hypothetical protein THARTR1_01804 [Trichoderma harzianum]